VNGPGNRSRGVVAEFESVLGRRLRHAERAYYVEYSAGRVFAVLVIIHYLGVTATNIWNYNDFPPESRAAQMAVPLILRGILFAGIYALYYLVRGKTVEGFGLTSRCS
jgi:hypothetical protein